MARCLYFDVSDSIDYLYRIQTEHEQPNAPADAVGLLLLHMVLALAS